VRERRGRTAIVGGLVTFVCATALAGAPGQILAFGADARIVVLWEEDVGADSYNIYRGTTPVRPAAPILTGVICASIDWPGLGRFCTTADRPVSNGVTLHYWVSSVTGGVESAASGPADATPEPEPQPPGGLRVERNLTRPGPSMTVPPYDAGILSFEEDQVGSFEHGAVDVTYRFPGTFPGLAPSVNAYVEGPAHHDLALSRPVTPSTDNLHGAAEARWSDIFFQESECGTVLHVVNRSATPLTVNPWLKTWERAPVDLGAGTIEPGRHLWWLIEGAAATDQKSDCFRGSVWFEHDGAEPDDAIAHLQSMDVIAPAGGQFETRVVRVGRSLTGRFRTSGLTVSADDTTRVPVRNNAMFAELDVESTIYLDGGPVGTHVKTLWLYWDESPDPGLTGYRVYRRLACVGEACNQWQQLADLPPDVLTYADSDGIEYDVDYSYRVVALKSYFNEGTTAAVDEGLPTRFGAVSVRSLPRFTYGPRHDTTIFLRNTIRHAIQVALRYFDPAGVELGVCAYTLPPNRAATAEARLCLESTVGAEAEGAVLIEHTGGRGALLAEARWASRSIQHDIPSIGEWRGAHPGRSWAPFFYVNSQVRLKSTMYLQNMDDHETEVIATYEARELHWTVELTCTGEPIVLAPYGSAVVDVLTNAGGCLDGSSMGAIRLDTSWTGMIPPDAESHVAAFVATEDRGEAEFVPEAEPFQDLYEGTDPVTILDVDNAVAGITSSPFDWTPAGAALLFYRVDDGEGQPAEIRMTRNGPDVKIWF